MLSDYKTALNKNSKKFIKSRDGVKKISNDDSMDRSATILSA